MIKANELRIGNYIQGGIINSIGYKIGVQGNSSKEVFYIHESTLQPIPLTPEILERCGFEKHGEKDEIRYYLNDFYFEDISLKRDECFIANVEYLHQLQNLYFALTGQELEFTQQPATIHSQS